MTRWRAGVLSAIAAVAMTFSGVAAANAETQHLTFDLQAHRGGLGLRPESTLASFANGLRVGVTTLEMDLLPKQYPPGSAPA